MSFGTVGADAVATSVTSSKSIDPRITGTSGPEQKDLTNSMNRSKTYKFFTARESLCP